MKSRFPVVVMLSSLIFVSSSIAAKGASAPKADAAKTVKAESLPSANVVIKKVRDVSKSLKSYSFDVHRFDLADKFVLQRNEEGLKAYKAIIDKLSFLTRQSKDVSNGEKGFKESVSTVLFIKPYTIQYYMEVSGFVPSFLQKSKVIYRPEINDSEIFLKEPYLGMLIRKDIENESASALIQNETYELMEIDCAIANGGTMKIAGTDTYEGKKMYILEIALKKGKIPWAIGCGGGNSEIPKKAYTQINRELGMMADRMDTFKNENGIIRFLIDAGTWLIMKKEVMFGKMTAIRYTITDMKLNNVKPDDLEMVKKK
jgi:hypothetical protein